MDKTRSGRVVKKSSKEELEDDDFDLDEYYDDMSEDFEDYKELVIDSNIPSSSNKRKSNLVPRKDDSMAVATSSGKISLMGMLSKGEPINQGVNKGKTQVSKKLPLKKDPAFKFYSAVRKMLSSQEFKYPVIKSKLLEVKPNENHEILNILKDEIPKFTYDSKEHSVHVSYEKTNEKIKEILGVNLDYEELSKVQRMSTYQLFTMVSRKKQDKMGQRSFMQQQLSSIWNKMPERTRRDWEIKSNKIKRIIEEQKKKEMTELEMNQRKRSDFLSESNETIEKAKLLDYNLIDLCGYFYSISTGFDKLCENLRKDSNAVVSVHQVESKLLDYLLSSIVSLIAIFEETEGLDRPVSTNSLNKMTFILPL